VHIININYFYLLPLLHNIMFLLFHKYYFTFSTMPTKATATNRLTCYWYWFLATKSWLVASVGGGWSHCVAQ